MADETLNAQFATQVGKIYSDTADQVDAYIDANFDTLKQSGNLETVQNYEKQLTNYSEQFIALSNDMLFTGAEDCFAQLGDATDTIRLALVHIQEVNKIINIVASTLSLAENILTGNIKGIAMSVKGVIDAAKAPTNSADNDQAAPHATSPPSP